ncbi:hypothetical protein ACHAWT_008882 [Skeletonema menzelii]
MVARSSIVFLKAASGIGALFAFSTSAATANSNNGQPLQIPLEVEESIVVPPRRRHFRNKSSLRQEQQIKLLESKGQRALHLFQDDEDETSQNNTVLPLPAAFLPDINTDNIITENTNNLKQPRIIGGQTTTRDRYPYAASLIDAKSNRHLCGGTLIAPDIILTAGHCSGHFNAVQIGRHNIIEGELEAVLSNNSFNTNVVANGTEEEEDGYEYHVVEKHVVHPLHANVIRSDFAVAKLFGSVTSVQPVRLNSQSSIPSNDDMVTVMGYGIIKKDGNVINDLSAVLLEADVQYMPNAECALTSAPFNGQTVAYDGYIDENMLCAWKLNTDACQGDSGGGLIYESSPSSNNPEDDVQIGIVSWGLGCALPAFPGVYARISEEIDWITEQVCDLSDDPPDYFNCTKSSSSQPQQDLVLGVTQDVTVVVELDDKPQETAWMLELDLLNAAGGSGNGGDNYKPFGSYMTPSTATVEVLSLLVGKQYKFTVMDRGVDNKNTKFRLCYGNVSREECMGARKWDEESIVLCEGISRYNLVTSTSCLVVLQTARPTPRPTVSPTLAPTDAPMIEVWNDLMFGTIEPFFKPPTVEPTEKPTITPTAIPSMTPTDLPTPRPSNEPSVYVSKAPAKEAPTDFFSKFDTDPTSRPTDSPTLVTTDAPTRAVQNDQDVSAASSASNEILFVPSLLIIALSTIYYLSSWRTA